MEKLRTPGLISKDKRGYSWLRARAMHQKHVQCTKITCNAQRSFACPSTSSGTGSLKAQGPAHSKLRDRLTQSSGTGSLKAQGPAHSKLRDRLTQSSGAGSPKAQGLAHS